MYKSVSEASYTWKHDMFPYMKLWQISRRMGGGQLSKAGSCDISGRFFCILGVLEERTPKQVCNTFQLAMRTMSNDLEDTISWQILWVVIGKTYLFCGMEC